MLSYIEHFHILAEHLLEFLLGVLELLLDIRIRIMSSAIGFKICAIIAGINNQEKAEEA